MHARIYWLVVSGIFVSGCSSLAARTAKEATPNAVEAGLESAARPENKERIRTILAQTPVEASVAALSPEIIDTILSRLAARENERLLSAISRSIARGMEQELLVSHSTKAQKEKEEATARAVALAVHAAIDELRRSLPALISDIASDQRVRDAIAPLTKSIAGEAVEGAGEAVTGGQ